MKQLISYTSKILSLPLITLSLVSTSIHAENGLPLGPEVAEEQRAYARAVTIPSFELGSVTIVQDRSNTIPEAFVDPATRKCKPFCVQPTSKDFAEVISLEKFAELAPKINSNEIILVDMRTPSWHKKGHIPGSINIAYSDLTGRATKAKAKIKKLGNKPVIGYCNGWWCGQSSAGLKALSELGYTGKLYSLRGGMQDWVDAGLTVKQ